MHTCVIHSLYTSEGAYTHKTLESLSLRLVLSRLVGPACLWFSASKDCSVLEEGLYVPYEPSWLRPGHIQLEGQTWLAMNTHIIIVSTAIAVSEVMAVPQS